MQSNNPDKALVSLEFENFDDDYGYVVATPSGIHVAMNRRFTGGETQKAFDSDGQLISKHWVDKGVLRAEYVVHASTGEIKVLFGSPRIETVTVTCSRGAAIS